MKLEGETPAAGDGQGDVADSWDTSGIAASRSCRKDTVILADTQLSFHIISPNPLGKELSSKKPLTRSLFPCWSDSPLKQELPLPTSNQEAEGAALVMHMQQGKWVYFHLYWPSQLSKSILWKTDRSITKQSKIKSQFLWGFFQHLSFIMIPLLKAQVNRSSCVMVKKLFEIQETALLFPPKKTKADRTAEMKISVKSQFHQPAPQAGITYLPHFTPWALSWERSTNRMQRAKVSK